MALGHEFHNAANPGSVLDKKSVCNLRQTQLFRVTNLCNPEPSPFFFVEDLECSSFWVEVVFRNGLQHAFWEHNMAGWALEVTVFEKRE